MGYIKRIIGSFNRKKMTVDNITKVNPYYNNFAGDIGSGMCVGGFDTDYIALPLDNSKTRRMIVKITSKKHFSDFGSLCTNFEYKITHRVLS